MISRNSLPNRDNINRIRDFGRYARGELPRPTGNDTMTQFIRTRARVGCEEMSTFVGAFIFTGGGQRYRDFLRQGDFLGHLGSIRLLALNWFFPLFDQSHDQVKIHFWISLLHIEARNSQQPISYTKIRLPIKGMMIDTFFQKLDSAQFSS
jgi:hypothetical protein